MSAELQSRIEVGTDSTLVQRHCRLAQLPRKPAAPPSAAVRPSPTDQGRRGLTSIFTSNSLDLPPDVGANREIPAAHGEEPAPAHTLPLDGSKFFDEVRSEQSGVV